MANTRLTRTVGTPTLNTKYTFSFWVKRALLTYSDAFMVDGRVDANNRFKIAFQSADKLEIFNSNGGSNTFKIDTNRQFRDTSAWYHIVLAVDTTDGTAGDRVKLYINGSRETSFASETTPSSSDANNVINESGATISIGAYYNNTYGYEGIISHFHFVDGTAYAPTVFGSTDATTGEWKINTSPSVTYGNNGFFILKDGNSVTDQSGNSNNFTVANGTLTNTEDCPSNVFAVFNRVDRHPGTTNNYGDYLSRGNTKITIASAQKGCLRSTIGVTSGKYYWEAKVISKSKGFYGVCNSKAFDTSSASIQASTHYSGLWYYENGPSYYTYNNNTNTTSIDSVANNDILCFALDMDNYAFYIRKNDSAWMNSGDPSSGSSRTGSIAELFTYGRNVLTDFGEVFINHYNDSGSGGSTVEYNFGNGYFGTTAITSEGTNASGIGKFEFNVPANYTSLSTKGLNL